MWNWLKRKRSPEAPTFHDMTIGELEAPSGALLLGDPMRIYDPVRVEGVPPEPFLIEARLIHYPEGGVRIAQVRVTFRPGPCESRQTLGTIGVDSAKVVAVDARACEQHWKHVGPERIGHVGIPGHRKIARLIGRKFGLRSRQVSYIVSEFEEPISEELEARITAYLQTFPEYAEFPFIYFRIKTMNTCDRINEAMQDYRWNEVVLDEESGARLLAFSSGFGDGSYPVEGLYASGQLVGVEIEFIGPAQDEILEAFPVLRY